MVVTQDGPDCGCGGRGCVEQYAGQEVLLRTAGQPDLERLEAAVAARDPAALIAVAQAGSALGVGLASLLNVIDLPNVVLGGMYARLFDAITPALTDQLNRRVLAPRRPGRLSRSPLGIDAAVRGAAGAVLDRALRDPAGLSGSGGSSGSSTPWRTPRTGRGRTGRARRARRRSPGTRRAGRRNPGRCRGGRSLERADSSSGVPAGRPSRVSQRTSALAGSG